MSAGRQVQAPDDSQSGGGRRQRQAAKAGGDDRRRWQAVAEGSTQRHAAARGGTCGRGQQHTDGDEKLIDVGGRLGTRLHEENSIIARV